MRPLAAVWVAVAASVTACASAATVRPTEAELARPVRTSVEVPLPGVPLEQAINRVKAAFSAEGLVVASTNEGVVVSEPLRVRSRLSTEIDKRYTATLIRE